MTDRNGRSRSPTELQQAILDVIWSKREATAEQVREALHATRPLKDSSIRTLLRRLEEQGYLTHAVSDKVFVYRAASAPQSLAARAVRHIIDRFCAGSVEAFLTGMVDEKVLTARQLERLAQKVKTARNRK